MDRPVLLHVAILLALTALGVGTARAAAPSSQQPTPSPARQAQLIHLVRQDCGACHGMQLSGGLGPALDPARLADLPEASLVATVLQGRPGTPMPGWQAFLSASEAGWIITQLKQGFPPLPPCDPPSASC